MKILRLAFFCLSVFWTLGLSAKDYALFFAVNDYQSMADLTNPVRNAKDLAAALGRDYNFVTEVVENPSIDAIEDKLQIYAAKFASGAYDQDGQLLVFFSGHGMTYGSNGYFMPADADEERPHRSGMEYDVLRTQLNGIACKHILVVIDACYSISFDPKWPSRPDRVFGPPGSKEKDQVLLDHRTYRTRRYFTSDAEENQTPDKSTLAYQFLAGLRKYKSYTGYLTADELFSSYLRKAAPTPGSGKFGDNEPAARFLFFRKQQDIPVDTRADLAAWTEAKNGNNCAAYRNYLSRFPRGDFAGLARQQVEACEAEETMVADWLAAKASNTRAAYNGFIAKHGDSPYVEAARLALQTVAATPSNIGNTSEITPPDNMVFIPGGTFQMGDQFGDGRSNEKPVHAVTLSDFYLSRTELTFAEYDRFCAATGRDLPNDVGWGRDQRPAISVSWLDAIAYCNWWSEQSGYTPVYTISGDRVTANWSANGYRLPTEAEWEYAARSGGKKQRFGNGQDVIRPTEANFNAPPSSKRSYSETGTYRKQTVPVSSFSPNGLGLADMSGNVLEWCWDWYDSDYYGKSPSSNPRGPDSGSYRVIRGGSWHYYPVDCRVAYRDGSVPTDSFIYIGFRLARGS